MTAERTTRRSSRLKSGPLAGVRVVDLTSTLMGPYCTQILADMGADVIKVESPQGDTTRYLQPGRSPGMSPMFVNLGRGKRSIVIDLKQERGREVLLGLLKDADVFVHSMRRQAMVRLGLAYEDLAVTTPDIVYANLYGYGRQGRYADWPAYDDTIQGLSGLAMLQAGVHGEPRYVPTVVADKVGGLTAAYAIAMALFHRERSGEGQEVEIGMFETMVSFLLVEHVGGALFEPRIGGPLYQRVVTRSRKPYRTADGHVSVLVYSDKQWQRFLQASGNLPLLTDPRFATLEARSAAIDFVYSELERILLGRTTQEWLSLFTEAEIPAVPLNTIDDLFDDPHLGDVGFFVGQESAAGRLNFPGIPTAFSKTPGSIDGPGPDLGEHTREVLAELGLQDPEIASLLADGIVRQRSPGPPDRGCHPESA